MKVAMLISPEKNMNQINAAKSLPSLVIGAAGGEPPENQTNQIKHESCNFDFSLNPNQRCQITPLSCLQCCRCHWQARSRGIKQTKSNMKFAMLISPEKSMNQNQRRKITSLTCLQCCCCHWQAPEESNEPNQT